MANPFLTGALAVVGFFTAIIVWIYMHYSSRHRERMALLEHSKDASIFERKQRAFANMNALKYGMVGVMAGIGLLVGGFLNRMHIMEEEVAYLSMMLIMGGAGMVAYYYVGNKEKERQDSDIL